MRIVPVGAPGKKAPAGLNLRKDRAMRTNVAIVGFVAALACSVIAHAGSLPIDPGDPNGMAGFKGSLEFPSSDNPVSLMVAVEFCVFAPGTFDDVFTVPAGDWNADHYYYTFQVLNDLLDGVFPPTWSEGYVGRFSVGIKDGDEAPGNIGYVDEPIGINPISTDLNYIPFGQIGWNFETGPPALGWPEVSDVLYYSSPYPPTWWIGSVSGNGSSAQMGLPKPQFPEPTTLALLAAGAALLGTKRT